MQAVKGGGKGAGFYLGNAKIGTVMFGHGRDEISGRGDGERSGKLMKTGGRAGQKMK